jgi:hypothetical protein
MTSQNEAAVYQGSFHAALVIVAHVALVFLQLILNNRRDVRALESSSAFLFKSLTQVRR